MQTHHEKLSKYIEWAELLKKYIGDDIGFNRRLTDKYWKAYTVIFDSISDGIYEWNFETGSIFTSPRLESILGITEQDGLNISYFAKYFICQEDLSACEKAIENLQKNPLQNDYSLKFRIYSKSCDTKEITTSGSVIRDENKKILRLVGSVSDLSEQEGGEENCILAACDELTGLPTKRALSKFVTGKIRNGDTCGAVIVMDLDNFKSINDTLDHFVGDRVIKKVSEILLLQTAGKGIAVRLSTDEFAIYLDKITGVEQAVEFSQELMEAIKIPIKVGETTVCVTASLGISMYPEHGETDQALLRYADVAMQYAKSIGKDNVTVFDYSMFERILRHETVERAIRQGLAKNEFKTYYQPQYDAKTAQITGFEALLRLESSIVGSISPAEFIPVAEETGYIHELGRWVFTEACKTAVEFKQKGYIFGKMAINVSLVQLQKKTFSAEIGELIRTLRVDPSLIELEITETQLVEYIGDTANVVKSMESLGMDLALDDFGSGYSSLNQLRQLWINTLKIDKKFIDHIATDPKDYEIVKLVVDLAHCLKLCVVAEGVETRMQLEVVKELGCDKIQGFYFSKAVPKSEAEMLLEKQKMIG